MTNETIALIIVIIAVLIFFTVLNWIVIFNHEKRLAALEAPPRVPRS